MAKVIVNDGESHRKTDRSDSDAPGSIFDGGLLLYLFMRRLLREPDAEKVVNEMKTFEIWITKDWSEIYEARTAIEAIEMMRKETGFYYFWDIRIRK